MEDYDKQLLSMSLPQLHREMTQLRRQKTLDATYRLTACQAHIDLLGISQRDVVLWTVTGNELGYDVRPIEQTKQFDPPIMIGDEEVLVYANMTPSLLIPLTHGMYTEVSTDLLREKLLAQDHPAGDNRSYDLTNYRDLAVDLLQSPELDTYFYGDVLKLACSSTKLPMLDALFGCVYEKQLAGTSPDLGDLPMSPAAASMMLLPLSTPLPRGRGEVKVPLAQLVTNWPDSGSLVVMNEKHAVVYSGDDGSMQKCAMLVDGVPTGGFYATNMRDTYLSSNARVYFAVSKDDFELITKYLEQAGKSATETRSLDEWGVILRAAVFNTHTQFLRDVSTETTLRIAGNLDAGVQPTIISAQSDDVQPLQAPDGAYVFLNGSPVWQFQKPAGRVILVGNGAGAYIEMEDPRRWKSERVTPASAEAIAEVVRTALKALRPSFSPDPEQINTVQLSVAVLRDSLKMYREVPEQNQRLLFAKDIAIDSKARIEIHVDGRSQNVTDVSLLTADDSVVLVCTQEQVDFLCELMSTKIDVEKMDFAARNQLLTTIVATVPVQLLWKYLTDADGTVLKGALDSRRAAKAYAEEEAKRAAEREKQQAQVAEASLDGAMYALGNPARAVNPKLGALAGKDTVEVDKYEVTLSGEQFKAYLDTMYSGDVTPAFKRRMEDLDYVTIHVRRDTHGLLELGGSNVGVRGKSLIKQHWAVLASIIRDLFDTAVRKYSGALAGDMERFSLTDLYRSLPIIIKRSTGPLQMSAKDDSFKLMRKDTHLLHRFDLSSPTLVSDLLLFTWGTKYLNEKYFAFYTHLSNEQWAVLAVNLFGAGADVNNIDLKQMQDELDLRRYSWPQFLAAVSAPKVASTPKSGAEPVDAEAARRVVWPSLLAELYGLGFRVSGPNQAKLSFYVKNDRGDYDSSDRSATLTVSYTDASLTAQVTADNLPSGNVDEVYVLVDGSAEAVTQRVRDLLGTVKGASLIGDMPTPIAANYLLSGEDGAPIVSEMAREVLGYAKQGFIGAGTTSAASTLAAFSKLAAADNWGCLIETKNVGSLLEHPDMSNSFTLTSDGAVQVFEMQFSYAGDDKRPSDWVCGLVRVQADGAFCFWATNGQPDSGWKRLISEMYGDYDDRNTNAELFVEEMQQPSIPTKAEADKVFSVFRDMQNEEGYLVAGAETMLMKSQPWISDTVEIPSMPVLAGVYSPDSLEESDLLSGVLSEGSLARGSLSGDCWAVFQTNDGRYLRVLSRVLGFRAFNRETASGTLYAPPKSFSSYTPRNYKLLQWAETGAVKNGPSHAGYAVLCDAGDELSKHLKNYNLDDIPLQGQMAGASETYLLCSVPTPVGYAQFKLLPYEGHNILLGDKAQADDTPVLTEVNDTITPRLDTGAWVKDTASAMAAAGLPHSEVSLEMLMHFGMYIVECGGKFPLFASIGVDRDGVLYPDDLRGTGLRYSNAPDMLPLVSAKLVLGQLYEYYRNQARCPTIEGIKQGRLDKMPSCDWPASENAALQFACKQLVALGRKNNSRTENGIAVSAPKDYNLERQMFALFDKPLWSLSGVDLVKHYVSLLAFVHNTEKRNAVPAPTASTEPTTHANTTFRYGLFNRPAGIGTVPAGLEFSVEPRPDKGQPFYESARHGILVTKRPLTDAEIKNFELVRLAGEADLPDVAAQVAKPMLKYAASYLASIEQGSRMFTDKVTDKTRDMNIDVAQPDKLVAMVIDLLKQHVAKQ